MQIMPITFYKPKNYSRSLTTGDAVNALDFFFDSFVLPMFDALMVLSV
jgi:hypothetical protein